MAQRMIPVIWIRLLVILGFGAFMVYEGMWALAAIAAVLAILSAAQLVNAYRQRAGDRGK
ncbi:hypothetical protein [Corynebacterium halotolerans]|uniref:Uncharacterized protein n=1 Tax=Corynebacterium halotolerans YIM 70093 = DSM 44683 TaxID=1121362 RepID=M1MXH6_9CORY|nr:hypothetical protein [Corynebacterium halotolerans]AGF72449.1 hypothetical protein A605_07235 [Corynebacterium halotolerans YIM 70093 = DSM 44683]